MSFMRRQEIYRRVRATLPMESKMLPARSMSYIAATPQFPFRVLQFWTYSPGPDLRISDLRAGNISLFASSGYVPAEAFDIVAVTEAVRVALAAGYRPPPGEAHPFYDRLKITPETMNVGVRFQVLVENPTDKEVLFKASLHGLALHSGRDTGGFEWHDEFDESKVPEPRFDDLAPSTQTRPALPPPPPVPRLPPPPDSVDGRGQGGVFVPTSVLCKTCGAVPGTSCYGLPPSRVHPSRGLRPGECPGCPRAAWAGGFQAACTLCGRTRP